MKKILSIIISALLAFSMSFGMVSCANPKPTLNSDYHEFYILLKDSLGETYSIHQVYTGHSNDFIYSYDKIFPAEFGAYFNVNFEGVYDENGQPRTHVACEDLSYDEEYLGIDLGEVGNHLLRKGLEFTVPIEGTNRAVHYLVQVDFNVQVTRSEKSIHDYVTMKPETILFSYFDCEMQEVSEDTYDLSALTKMLGDRETDNYQYGYYSCGDYGNGASAYNFLLYNHKTENGSLYITKQSHSNYKENYKMVTESYQYEQVKDGKGYLLHESDGVFSTGTYTTSGNPGWHYEHKPTNSKLLKESANLTYKAGERDGCIYLSITGEYNDYPNRLEYYNLSCEMIYVIKDNKIIAWLYTHVETSPIRDGEWKLAEYCIPLETSIELVDETLLESICVQ